MQAAVTVEYNNTSILHLIQCNADEEKSVRALLHMSVEDTCKYGIFFIKWVHY